MALPGWSGEWLSVRRKTLPAGQSLVIVALAFIGLLAFVGFAVDAGILFMHRVWLRQAVDAAALAGAFELPNENAACARVVNYLEYQGYSPGADFNFKLIFPEGSELDAYPSIPSSPTRVIDSPSMSTCSSLSIAGDHFEVWVTADQELGTFFLGLVGLNRLTTGQPAVAQKPEAFDVVFVIPNPDSMRTDTCLYERADDSYLASPDFYGNSYGCTYPHSSVSQIEAIANPGFETGMSGWLPMQASIANDDFHSGSAAVKLRRPSPPCTPYAQCPRISQTFTTEATDLYLAFWLKPLSMETSYTSNQAPDFLNLEVRWDTDGDGTVDSSTIWPLIVQWCDPESGSPECRFCPDQFMGGSYKYGETQGRQYYCEARINAAANSTGWKYAVVEIPSGAWSSPGPATIEIKFVLQSKKSPGPDPEDAVLIDDVALYSAPWLQGPRARYILSTDAEGRAACENVNDWPNSDNTWNPPVGGNTDPPPPYGSNYTPPDVLFPARGLMQQPLYDVLLAIGKDPAMGGPDSFMDMLSAGHRFGFVLYHMTTYLTGCVNGPHNNSYFQSGTDTYADFRFWLFNGISSYPPDITNCGNYGGGGNNHAGGIAGARKFLNTYGREDTNRTIVLLSHRTIDINCGEGSDTYCYGQTACSTPECLENAKYWLDRQVQYAASEGITIFTIGIGRKADMELMQRIAEPTGGTWYHASSTSELPLRFRQIYEDMKRMVRLTR